MERSSLSFRSISAGLQPLPERPSSGKRFACLWLPLMSKRQASSTPPSSETIGHMRLNQTILLVLFLWFSTTASAADDIDRIIQAIGVDSIHSENEEPRTREALRTALLELAKSQPNSPFPTEGPGFDDLVKRAMDVNQQLRRNPLVVEAYRTTLSRMLTPEELAIAAAFYSSPTGRKAHIAAIEAEKAAAAAMDKISGDKQ